MPAPRFGPYEVEALLAEGSQGRVYRVLDTTCGRRLALKLAAGPLDAQRLARFAREVAALGRLSHPHVLRVHVAGQEQGRPWVVTELIEGESLATRLERGPLPIGEVLTLGRALAGALAHVHEAGLVHRDLKPDNVLLRASDGAPLLVDFGVARDEGADALTRTGALVGTLGYAAPEQLQPGLAPVGPPADLFGLGGTLYAALVGRPPADGTTPSELFVATTSRPPAPPSRHRPDVPRALEALVLRCLAKRPGDRPASASELALALAGCDAAPPRRGSRAPVAAGGALVVVLAAAGALVALRTGPTPAVPPPAAVDSSGPTAAPPAPAAEAGPEEPLARARRLFFARGQTREAFEAWIAGRDAAPTRPPEPSWWVEGVMHDTARPSSKPTVDRLTIAELERALDQRELALARQVAQSMALVSSEATGREWLLIAAAFAVTEDDDRAGASFAAAVKADPELVAAWIGRAYVLQRVDALEAALADARQAARLAPHDPYVQGLLGSIELRLGHSDAGLRALGRALAVEPDYVVARVNRGNAYYGLGQLDAARAEYDRAIELEPEHAEAWGSRGQVREQQGDRAGAAADYRRGVEGKLHVRSEPLRARWRAALDRLEGQ